MPGCKNRGGRLSHLNLNHCKLGAAQTWGSLRWIPILRPDHRSDLRLSQKTHGLNQVRSSYPQATYHSYMPQAMVVRWDPDGEALATEQTHLDDHGTLAMGRLWKRQGPAQLAFLPQSLAIEGFLVRHFRGPDVAWLDYQREVRRGTLGIRFERSLPGWYIQGLEEALRRLEWIQHQVGCALLLDEELIQVFLTPHPEDYAHLHESLLQDAYPEHLVHYGYLRYQPEPIQIDHSAVRDWSSLCQAYAGALENQRAYENLRLEELIGRMADFQTVYQVPDFKLGRFVTSGDERGGFAGEAIWHSSGSLEYLKLFRLSRAQYRRYHLLSTLARYQWSFLDAAPHLGVEGKEGVARSLIESDLGYLLNPGLYGHLLTKR